MLLPYVIHGVQRDSFRLGQEKKDENSHQSEPTGVEEEHAKLEVAEHCQECLRQHESCREVDRSAYALACWSDFEGENFAWNEPRQRTP